MNDDQYRELIHSHSRSHKNGVFPSLVNLEGSLTNPLCGDFVELKLNENNSIIESIGYHAKGCALCCASSSLMSEVLQGKSIKESLYLASLFEEELTSQALKDSWPSELEDIICLSRMKIVPSRKLCVLLPWVVLKSTLKKVSKNGESCD